MSVKIAAQSVFDKRDREVARQAGREAANAQGLGMWVSDQTIDYFISLVVARVDEDRARRAKK